MAKDKERILAKQLYLKGKLQKEIAAIVKVQEKTIGDWVKKFGWKEQRDARFNSTKSHIESLRNLIGKLTDRRLDLIRSMDAAHKNNDIEKYDALEQKANKLADEVSKYNKALISLDKENRISLSVYIDVMESIFKAIQVFDTDLYMKLIDFQEQHLTEISLKIG